MRQVGIISAGAWGTALGKCIAEKGHLVQMWDYQNDVVNGINNDHINHRYLAGVELPKTLSASSNIEAVADGKRFILLATPSQFILETMKRILHVPGIREGETHIGVVTKGFLPSAQGPKLILTALEDYLPGFYRNNLVYISGPSHAEEVSQGKLTGLISASSNPKNSIRFRTLLSSKSMMVFSSLDAVGVQVCAAVKNVIAIGFGILDALKDKAQNFGDNTESLLLAAGLNEIQAIGRAMGSTHPETFTSIAGVGDLDVTCRSVYGRNRRFGRDVINSDILARFTDINDLCANIMKIGYLPEGVNACRQVKDIRHRYRLKLIICETVYKILNKELDPLSAVETMLPQLNGSFSD